jgi:quercetin dioxygenase-like cupin family protein
MAAMEGVYLRTDGEYRVVTTWGTITWLAGHSLGNADTLGLTRVLLKHGKANRRHAHLNCEVVIHLIRGAVRCSVGEDACDLLPGETVCIPPGVYHHYTNTGNSDAEMIIAYGAGDRQIVLEEGL